MPSTLVIDDWNWPGRDLNQLYAALEGPWPNWLQYSVYQSLVDVNSTAQYQQGVLQFIPSLASSWVVSADHETYTFNLRQDVKFSDGNVFNAYQVWMEMYSFYYLTGNSTGWLVSYPVFDMSNVNFGPQTIAAITNSGGVVNPSPSTLQLMENSSWPIYVTNPYQIVFRLKAPFLWFLGLLEVYEGHMFDIQWVLDHGGLGTPASFNTYFNLNPIPGSGPYVVTAVSENNYVKLQQDPNYWGKNLTEAEIAADPFLDPGHVQTVVVQYKSDDVARYADLSTGTAQISAILSTDWNLVQANPDKYAYSSFGTDSLLMTFLSFNTQVYPTNNANVRQAIVHAINYTDIAEKAFFGQTTPIVGPEYPAYKDFYNLGNLSPYSYNVSLAEEYLAKAKITNFPTLTFVAVAGVPYGLTIAQIVQSDLAAINITVNISVVQSGAFYANLGSYSSDLQNKNNVAQIMVQNGVSWAPSALTPADDFVNWVSNQSSWGNTAIYYNPIVQNCVNSFTATDNVSYIQSLCKAAEIQIYNDAPYAWLGVNTLWDSSGSLVWQKGVIKSFLLDPVWGGENTAPIINTVTFGS
jgi:ABC-type transport system substrate-binding protein